MGVVEILIKAKDLTGAAFASTKMKLAAMKTSVGKVGTSYMTLGSKITSVMSAALMPIMLVVAAVYSIGKAVGSVLTSFGDFDTAMKAVEKTTGMAKGDIDKLATAFSEMSTAMPLDAKALAEIGAVAGQLGIKGVENIETFTETVAKVSVALQMTAEEAATSMAKIGNAFQLPITDVNNFASSINSLENTTAAAGSEIIGSITRMAASGAQLGLTVDQAAALGATLISTGMAAERVGTRLNRAFTEMAKKTDVMAEQMGVSNEEMRRSIETDVMGALNDYLVMLGNTPSAIDRITKANKVFGAIGGKAIAMLAGNYGALQTNLETANVAMQEGTSLHEEYLVFASSFDAQMEILKNKINIFAMDIGKKLAPAILSIGTSFTDTVIPGLVTFGEEISKQTRETWPNFKKAVSEAFGKLVGDTNLVTWENIMRGLGVAIGTVLNVILIGLEFIIEANGPFLAVIGGLVTCLTEFVSDIQNLSVTEAFTNLKNNIFTALGNIKDEIGAKVTPIVDAIITTLGKVKAKVSPIFEEVKTVIFAKLSSIKEGLEGVLGPVKTAIHNKLAAIKDGLAEKLAPITTVVLDALGNIKDKLDPIIDPLKTAIHTKLGAIKDGLEEKLGPVKTAIENVFTSAVTIIKTAFDDLPAAIGLIFTTIGSAITTFGENLPGFLGSGVEDLGAKFTALGDSFVIPTEDIKEDLGEVTGHVGIVGTAVETMRDEFNKVPAAVETIPAATQSMQEEVEADLDKVTLTVDGVEVSFDGLKGKVGDVVTEFGNFEDIAGELIGLDWSVFTTLKEELPDIDDGIGDMKTAFEGLKKVLDDNIDNLEDIQTDLGNIEKAITPFVNNIAPGITAVGDFATALSNTQGVLSTFASMSAVDIEGMLGFESAVHSMVMGLEILDGQIERLMPSFEDITSLIRTISDTFVYSGKKGENATASLQGSINKTTEQLDELGVSSEDLFDAMNSGWAAASQAAPYYEQLRELKGTYHHLTGKVLDYNEAYRVLLLSEEEQQKWVDETLHSSETVEYQLDKTTDALKNQTKQLTKISGAIEPLIDFMGVLNELYETTFGEEAVIWDAMMVQDVFATIGDTIGFMGDEIGKVDFGKVINEALDSSEEFRTAMREGGSELSVLTNYVEILLGNYVDLAKLMGKVAVAEGEMGDGAFEVSKAFEAISGYLEGLTTYLPTLSSELGTLNDLWGESGETIEESMTSYHKLMGVVKAISLSYVDFAGKMMELSAIEETAAGRGVDLSSSFEMVAESVGALTKNIPALATELDLLDDSWKKNKEAVNRGAIAFGDAMKPIQGISDSMIDFSDIMLISGDDIGAKFDSITDYIGKLTDFTPQLGSALSGLKTVWDENSGAINDGVSAFSNIVGAISSVQTSIGELITAEGDLQTAAEGATGAVDTEADALAGHSLSTSLDTTAAASAQLQAATIALEGAMGPLTGAVSAVAGALSGELVGALGAAANAMANLAGGAYSAGLSIAYSFADGIYSGIGAVEAAASALAGVVASYLSVHSNTELGALSDLMEWGPNVVKTFTKGIQSELGGLSKTLNDMPLGALSDLIKWGPNVAKIFTEGIQHELGNLSKTLNDMPLGSVSMSGTMGIGGEGYGTGSVSMTGTVGSGGGNSTKKVYITISQTIDSKADADYAVREIERLMKKPQII